MSKLRTSSRPASGPSGGSGPAPVWLRQPAAGDGKHLWRIARDSRVLDLNSSYSYVLWCRDFPATSIVAETENGIVGFVSGYVRPQAPGALFIWQVAVTESQRGKGLGVAMLDQLLTQVNTDTATPVTQLETTISPGNIASIAMFTALARQRNTTIIKQELFGANDFPDAHEAEELYLLGPIPVKGSPQ